MFGMILLIGSVSAETFTFDNILNYEDNDLKATIVNTFGLGKDLGTATLKSHNSVDEVLEFGYGKEEVVMYYDFTGWELYKDGLGEVYFTDVNTGEKTQREYYFVEWVSEIETKNIYEDVLVKYLSNGRSIYEQKVIGTYEEEVWSWKKLENKDIPDRNARIGLKTYVNKDDYVDVIWTIAGKKIKRHASYSASLKVSLVSYWDLDETSGNALDKVGDNDGTVTDATQGVTGILNTSYDFDGINAKINGQDVGFPLGSTARSISMWVELDTVAVATQELFNYGNDVATQGWLFSTGDAGNENKLFVGRYGGNADAVSNTSIAANTWTHIGITWDSNAIIYYTNGKEAGTATMNSVNTADATYNIGEGWNSINPNGAIDEVAIWSRAISGSEMLDIWNNGNCLPLNETDAIPEVTLNSPIDTYNSTSSTITFNATASDDTNLVNVSFILNNTYNSTNSSGLNGSNYINTLTLTDGLYNWTYEACDNASQCTNATVRTFTINTTLNVQLISPTNETIITTLNNNFTVNYTSTGFNITNVTYFIWYSNNTIFNQTTVNTNQAITNQTILFIGNFTLGNYLWNAKVCGTDARGLSYRWAENNYTFTISGKFSDFIFDSPIVETSSQTFYVLLEVLDGTTIQAGSGKLNYNGTDYCSITATNLGSNQYNLSRTIFIPAGVSGFDSENRSFFWNITVIDTTSGATFIQTSDTKNQNVTELKFGLCSSSLTIPMLNFTLYDENLGTVINASANAVTFQTTFEVGGHWNFMNKTVSVNNISVAVSEFDFCTNDGTNVFYTTAELFYNAAGFSEKNYYLTNATLTNTTNEINLYLLNESDSIEFFISVEQDLIPVTSAQVTVQKYFVGEGVFKTVEIDETSSDTGEFTAYFDLDKDYKFIITKEGTILGTETKTASCKEAPCEMTISLTSAVYNIYSVWGDEYAGNVLYNLSYNPNTKIITFDFIDTTGLANYFRMQTYEGKFNQSSELIFDTTTYSSSGTITANLSTYDKGNFIVYTYVSRSPEQLIDFLKIIISDLTGTFGLLGLFCAFLLVITIIFGLSHSPSALILSIPLSLTITQSIGILSIGWNAIILVWILSMIAFWAVSK